jgi:hypothetical protein
MPLYLTYKTYYVLHRRQPKEIYGQTNNCLTTFNYTSVKIALWELKLYDSLWLKAFIEF